MWLPHRIQKGIFHEKSGFPILYEVKNRELENICLLKYEIEKRGYSTEIINV